MNKKCFFVFLFSFCFHNFSLSQTADSKNDKLIKDLKQICHNFSDSVAKHSFGGDSDWSWQVCVINPFSGTGWNNISNMDIVAPTCNFVVASSNGCVKHSVMSFMKRSISLNTAKTKHEDSTYPVQTLDYDGTTHYIYFAGKQILFNHNLNNACHPPRGPWTCNEDGTSKPDF